MALTDDERDLLSSLGVTFDDKGDPTPSPGSDPAPANPPAQDPPAQDPPAADPAPQDPPAQDPPADPGADPKPQDPTPQEPPKEDKTAAAFAQMRIQNSTLKRTLENVATLLGIKDVNDPDTLAQALSDKVLEVKSEKEKVPLEMLKDIEHLKNIETQFTQEQLKQKAILGFQDTMKEYNLDQKQLNSFAEELITMGLNPYLQDIDLVATYRDLHWKDMIAAAEEKGRVEEAKRAAKAEGQGSDPGNQSGGKPGAQDPITSVKGLDDFFDKVK